MVQTDPQQPIDYSVIIVGAGPVGLTLANLLGLQRVRTLVVEKDLRPPDGPRAVSLDDESLRIWQQCGLIEALAPFIAEGNEGDVVFTYRSRCGRALFSMAQRGRPYGYARGNVFLFHHVLEVLKAGIERFPHVELRSGWTAQGCTQHKDHARLEIKDHRGLGHELRSNYLIGCDGGRSSIRNDLKISMQGSADAEPWLIVDTFDPTLAGQSPQQGVEVWCDKRCPTASIPLPDGYRRWEFLLPHEPSASDPPDDARIRRMIAERKPGGEVQIIRRLVHSYKGAVAEHYAHGPIFLAGDAAHLSPPYAGQGMATGLRDAANLSWKLAFVLRGHVSAALLDTYEQERRPHQLKMLRLARRMGQMMMPRTQLQEALVDLFFTLAGRFGWLRRLMEIRGANITPVYADRRKKQAGKAGHYLIQPPIGSHGLLDDLLGLNYAILSFDRPPQEALGAQELASWQCCGAVVLWIRPEGDTHTAYQAFDRWLGDCRRHLLIVRPDRFVKEDRILPNLKI